MWLIFDSIFDGELVRIHQLLMPTVTPRPCLKRISYNTDTAQAMTSADYPWYRGPHANEAVSASSNEQTIHPANLNGHLQAEPVETRSRSERSSQTCVSHREQNPLQQPDGISPDETEREDLSNFRIHHYFDFVGGTSTGG